MAKTVDELQADKELREAFAMILERLRPFDAETRRRLLEAAMVFYGFR